MQLAVENRGPKSKKGGRVPGRVAQALFLGVALGSCTTPKALTDPDGVTRTGHMVRAIGVRGIALAVVRYPVTGSMRAVQQHSTMAGSYLNPGMRTLAPGPETLPAPGTSPPMDATSFERLLDRKIKPRKAVGTVELLIDGAEYFTRFSRGLRESRDSVDVQMYIFDRDDFAVQSANELKAASQRVPVRVLFDDVGSLFAGNTEPDTPPPPGFTPPDDMAVYLRDGSDVEVRKLHNVFMTSTHSKIITLGPSLAYTGGMNIGREYRSEWHDLMAELRGPVVGLLQEEFDHAWARADAMGDWRWLWPFDRKRGRKAPATELPPGTFDIRVLRTRPFDYEIQKAIHLAIENARRRIWIQNPYFADDTLVRKLIEARRRGVDVRVILPEDADARVLNENNTATGSVMVEHGIRVFIYPRMTHVKAALFDGWALIGSANYDRLSLRLNEEVNICYSDHAAVRQLEERLFERDFRASREKSTPDPLTGATILSELAADAL